MTRLIILTIAMAMTPTVYAAKDIDREKHNYYCSAPKHLNPPKKVCKGIEKGDVISSISSGRAVLYCDKDELILQTATNSGGATTYSCVYNGREIRESKRLP